MRIFTFFILFLTLISCTEQTQSSDLKDQIDVPNTGQFILPPIPDEVELFGEKIRLYNFDLKERLDKEIIVNTYYHSSTIQILKRANRHFPLIEKILAEEGMPEDLKYLCVIESALRQATSPIGAKGFWQFMPATAKEYGMQINNEIDERLNIEKSTRAACEYMRISNGKFDNWVLASASYNCGVAGLTDKLENQSVSSFFDLHLNNETARYVFRIIALKLLMQHPEDYGFYPNDLELYEPVEINLIEINKSIENLTIWAHDQKTNLHMIKVLNPWLISNSLTLTGDQSYQIALLKK